MELQELGSSSRKSNPTYCQQSQTRSHELSKQNSNSTTNTSRDSETICDNLYGESTTDFVPDEKANSDYEAVDNEAPPLPQSQRPIFKFQNCKNVNPNPGEEYMSRDQREVLASTSSLCVAAPLENPSRVRCNENMNNRFYVCSSNFGGALLIIE